MEFSSYYRVFTLMLLLLLLYLCQESAAQSTGEYYSQLMLSLQANMTYEDNYIYNYSPKSDSELDTSDEILKWGYPVEKHVIMTDDGYILSVFRIPYGRASSSTGVRSPVLLMHGLLSSSDQWLLTGPDKALAFILADAGYDVWLGNARGNYYSRKHATLSPKYAPFWNFTWHEMGNNDLPAVIDHILDKTNQKQIFYVGHSMGCTMFFSLMTTQPEYNQKIRLMAAMAPGVYLMKQRNIAGELLNYARNIADGFFKAGQVEIFPRTRTIARLGQALCRDGQRSQTLCVNFYFTTFGNGFNKQLNKTLLPMLFAHFPAGTSTASADHFVENFKAKRFQWYDKTRSKKPMPKYDLSLVSAPIAIYYSLNDAVVHHESVIRLSKELPNLVAMFETTDSKFTHVDFAIAIDAKKVVYDDLMNVMMKY